MVVQHNISAMNANRYYGINNKALAGSLEKLSSGYAINRAGDNAAGLAVSEKMRSQIGGLTQATKNAEDAISMVQTFEGALQETDSILQRMKTLATQSANGTYQSDVDRDAIQLEFDQLNDELNQIADTDYNGVVVLNGGRMSDGTVAKDANGVAKTSTLPKIDTKTTVAVDPSFTYKEVKSSAFGGKIEDDGTGQLNGTLKIDGKEITVNNGAITDPDTAHPITGSITAGTEEGKFSGTLTTSAATSIGVGKDSNGVSKNIGSLVEDSVYTTDEFTAVDKFGNTNTYKVQYTGQSDGSAGGIKLFKKNGDTWGTTDVKTADGITVAANADNKNFDITTSSVTYEITNNQITTSETDTSSRSELGEINKKDTVSVPNAFEHGAMNMTYANSITLQVGSRSKDAVKFTFEYSSNGLGELNADMDASARGLGTDKLSLKSQESSNLAVDKIDAAINKVSMIRGTFGAVQNRLEHKINNLTTNTENMTAAESRIRDTQMDKEMMKFTSSQILSQASQSMLAQANSLPQGVLQLLG